jgi:hypothetical protein
MIGVKHFFMRLTLVLGLLLIASFSSASCVIEATIYSPKSLGSNIVNTTIPINLSVTDVSGGSALNATVNVTILTNNSIVNNSLIQQQSDGFYEFNFTPVTSGGYEAIFNVSNSSCSNYSATIDFFVFGKQSLNVPETNVFVVLLMFILIVGYFKWNRGLKNTHLKK